MGNNLQGVELTEDAVDDVLLEELVDEVLVVTTDDVELVLETVVVLVTVELEDGEGGSFPQGWLDSKSVAT